MSRSVAPVEAGPAPTLAKRILTAALGALRAFVTPFWSEPHEVFERRWQRLFLRGPIGGFVGLWFGVLATMQWGLPVVLFPALCGLAGVLVMSLAGHFESFIQTRTVSPSGRVQIGVAVAADLIVGAVLGTIMSFVLEAEAAALLATGAATLAVIHYVASQIFWGDWVERVVFLLSGHGGSGHRESDFSYEAALAAQGYVDEALARYEDAAAKPGASTAPLLHGAQLLRQEERYEEAIEWYRRAFDAPKVDPRRASVFVKHIVEICTYYMKDPSRAVQDVEALLDRYPEAPEVEWARSELEQLRSGSGGRALAASGE